MRLVFELLEKEAPADVGDWEALLNRLPKNAFEAYDKLLSNVSEQYGEKVRFLLHIIYIARRPLTLREANIALKIRGEYYQESIQSDVDDGLFQAWLEKECGFFVTKYDGRLFFIHQTVREFLRGSDPSKPDERPDDQRGPESAARPEPAHTGDLVSSSTKTTTTWKNSIKSSEDAHLVMLECCVASILMTMRHPKVQEALTEAHAAGSDAPIKALEDFLFNTNSFIGYSCENLPRHIEGIEWALGMTNEDDITRERQESARWKALVSAYDLLLMHPTPSFIFFYIGEAKMCETTLRESLEHAIAACSIPKMTKLLKQANADGFMRCSLLVWSCLLRRPRKVQSLWGAYKNREGNQDGSQSLSLACKHSEDVEALMAICVILCFRGPPRSDAYLAELLAHEEQKLSDNPDRKEYFLGLVDVINILDQQGAPEANPRLATVVQVMNNKWLSQLEELYKTYGIERSPYKAPERREVETDSE